MQKKQVTITINGISTTLEDFKALLEMPSEDELDEIRDRTRKIEAFLRSKFLEEWDSFEEA